MKIRECGDLGTLEYRLPNIPEAMILLGEMGLNSKKLSNAKEITENELIYSARLIEKLGRFVTKINITINEKKITKYNDLLNEFVMMEHLNEIGGEVFESLNVDSKKKILVQEACNLVNKGVPFDHVKEINEQRYNELIELTPFFQSFNIFMMAKNLGVSFRPEDLSMEELLIYSTIHTEMSKEQEKQNAR